MKQVSENSSWRIAIRSITAYEKAKDLVRSIRVFSLIVRLIVIGAVLAVPYWLFIASDRYVSEATVIIQRTDQIEGTGVSLPAVVAGVGGPSSGDQLLLREYLLSLDMLKKLDASLDLRSHFSDRRWDPISRMWFRNAPTEWFYKYWLSRISVDYDSYSSVLRIRVEAYDPKTAEAIVAFMVKEGDPSRDCTNVG